MLGQGLEPKGILKQSTDFLGAVRVTSSRQRRSVSFDPTSVKPPNKTADKKMSQQKRMLMDQSKAEQ